MSPYIYLPMKKGRRTRFNKAEWCFEFSLAPKWIGTEYTKATPWLRICPTQALLNELKGKLK